MISSVVVGAVAGTLSVLVVLVARIVGSGEGEELGIGVLVGSAVGSGHGVLVFLGVTVGAIVAGTLVGAGASVGSCCPLERPQAVQTTDVTTKPRSALRTTRTSLMPP